MEDVNPDSSLFPSSLTTAQEDLLKELKFGKTELQEEIQLLPNSPDNLNPKEFNTYRTGPEFSEFHRFKEYVDDLTVKAIRSFFRRVPGVKGFPGLALRVVKKKESGDKDDYQYLLMPGPGIKYHSELPLWALQHICEWIQDKRFLANDDDYDLLAKCKMGLETGLKEPLDYDLLERVLRARGFDIHSKKNLDKIRKIEGIKKSKRGRPKKRIRKDKNSWDRIAVHLGKIAKAGSIPTTGEGLKELLQRMFPDIDFNKV